MDSDSHTADPYAQAFIETDQFAALLAQAPPDLKVVNGFASAAQHEAVRIGKDDVLFEIGKISEPGSKFPNTLPSADEFKKHMVRLGIQRTHQIVCYDCHERGLQAVPRVAWMLRHFGAQNVRILNGGLRKWRAEGRPVVENTPQQQMEYSESDGDYDYAVIHPERCVDIKTIHQLVGRSHKNSTPFEADFQIVDARPKGKFDGTEPEPAGVRPGHIPNAINLFFPALVNEDGTFKKRDELAEVYKAAGISLDKPTYNACNSGVTACAHVLAQQLLGVKEVYLYDGSWMEYGQTEEPQF